MIGFTRLEEFAEERFQRLKETVSEYLDDEGQDPEVLINDIRRALTESSEYFRNRSKAYDHIQEFFK